MRQWTNDDVRLVSKALFDSFGLNDAERVIAVRVMNALADDEGIPYLFRAERAVVGCALLGQLKECRLGGVDRSDACALIADIILSLVDPSGTQQ